ncbi:hypothetical protein DFH07DRAFT_1066457 [Mycena maculata]|uniref:HMG box domain-containing protein n=1 Tax=Mycena maculata TaxID=230809 RepID=A0AAD7HTJ7_9AGAR|nr:hypothetical protein DFH07DRAFT_1066457 [Mycena maculata]
MFATQMPGSESCETRNNTYCALVSPDSPSAPPSFLQSTFMPLDTPESISRPQRTRHSRKQPDGHIPRPPNAFILFRSSFIHSQRVSSEVETSHSTLSKIIGLTWQNLPPDERRVWHAKARDAVEEHRRKFPTYAFRPLHRRTRPPGGGGHYKNVKDTKRKVREHGVDDPARCAKIAALVVAGKQGSELEAAVQEFDSKRAPGVVARFEPPMTAMAYRRSSSAPAPDTDPLAGFLSSAPTVSKRRRSSSSGPPYRSSAESDAPTQPEVPSQSDVFDDPLSPWTLAPEPDYFDFSGFSFAPTDAASPNFSCDSLWNHSNCVSASDDKSSSVALDNMRTDIPAFIAEDWARELQSYPDPAFASPALCGSTYHPSSPVYIQQQTYIETPRPHLAQIETGLARLMASLDA